jgi:hypothetical protein
MRCECDTCNRKRKIVSKLVSLYCDYNSSTWAQREYEREMKTTKLKQLEILLIEALEFEQRRLNGTSFVVNGIGSP